MKGFQNNKWVDVVQGKTDYDRKHQTLLEWQSGNSKLCFAITV